MNNKYKKTHIKTAAEYFGMLPPLAEEDFRQPPLKSSPAPTPQTSPNPMRTNPRSMPSEMRQGVRNLGSTPNNVPSMTNNVPSMTNNVPSMTNNVPSMTNNVPSMTNNVPSMTNNVPSMTNNVPSMTNNVPSMKNVPGINNVPSMTNNVQNQVGKMGLGNKLKFMANNAYLNLPYANQAMHSAMMAPMPGMLGSEVAGIAATGMGTLAGKTLEGSKGIIGRAAQFLPALGKFASYRDRATLILHDGDGKVFTAKDTFGGKFPPYFFPGGGVYEDEGKNKVPSHALVEKGLRREALEELGYKLKNIDSRGFKPTPIIKSREWQQRQLDRRGFKYKGMREHLRSAELAGEDKSILGSEGDVFHVWKPGYVEANKVANELEKHLAEYKDTISPSEYKARENQIKFIRTLSKDSVKTAALNKAAEEKRYRHKVQVLLYTPDHKILASKSQAQSGLRSYANYKFPGGGVEKGESLEDATHKELLEEAGYRANGTPIRVHSKQVEWSPEFRAQALAKGRDYHGEVSHFMVAPVGKVDKSLLGSEGDQLEGSEFVPISDLIRDLRKTSKKKDNEYAEFDKMKLEALSNYKRNFRIR